MEQSLEAKAWLNCNPKHLWIFDKLIVSRLSGHICGPRGIPVPEPGEYFVKPVTNIEGMGEKARKIYIEEKTTELLHPGEFWCEVFEGEHLSIDYRGYQPILKTVGTKHLERPYQRFTKWEKTDKWHPPPTVHRVNPASVQNNQLRVYWRQTNRNSPARKPGLRL